MPRRILPADRCDFPARSTRDCISENADEIRGINSRLGRNREPNRAIAQNEALMAAGVTIEQCDGVSIAT
jgi:hypothetical protein